MVTVLGYNYLNSGNHLHPENAVNEIDKKEQKIWIDCLLSESGTVLFCILVDGDRSPPSDVNGLWSV